MRTKSTRRWTLVVGLLLAMGPGASARAGGYFVNAFAGSPLASYLFGDFDNSTAAAATSATYYTDGVNVFSSTGSSAVDLATGSLHSLASADFGYDPSALPGMTSSFQFGNSSFGDSLTFLGNFTGQQATFHISVDGTWSGAAPSFNGSDFQFMVLPAGTIDANAGNTLNIFNNPGNVAIVNDLYALTPTTSNPLTFDVNVTLNGQDPTIEFAANLNIVTSLTLGQSFTADFTNTATVSFTAPEGVTVVSGSGVFPNTVPEPGSLTLALAGLASAGLVVRAQSRRARA
jgi:PEP-CTERM motif